MMAKHSNQDKAALMLATGASKTKVADSLGISRTTLYEWCGATEFQWKVQCFREEILGDLKEKAVRLYAKALDSLLTEEKLPLNLSWSIINSAMKGHPVAQDHEKAKEPDVFDNPLNDRFSRYRNLPP